MKRYDIFKKKGLSQTPFRAEIMHIFLQYNNAISISTIENNIINFDRTTLYRTLKKFIEKGIIHEIHIDGKEKIYALCQNECTDDEHHHHHIHFKCNKCNTTSCLNMPTYPNISVPGYHIEEIEIQAKGICKKCNNEHLT